MSKLTGNVIVTANHLAVGHHASADTIRDADVDKAIRTGRITAFQP
jgi:hypothetical protein